jgi:uncharacterized protein
VSFTDVFFPALALMLVMEGVLPFVAPKLWREAFSRMLQSNDGQLRFMGFFSMLAGLVLLWLSLP